MSRPDPTHRPRPAHRWLGVGTALALTGCALTGLAQTEPTQTAAQVVGRTTGGLTLSPSAAACLHSGDEGGARATGNARIRAGAQVADPDTFTAAQTRTAEAETSRRAQSRGLSENAAGRLTSRSGLSGLTTSRQPATATTVPVYWHTITDGTSGKLSATAINRQISVLNAAYKTAGFTFTVVKTTTTVNRDWFDTTAPTASGYDGDAADAKAMKAKLHVGTRSSLNIYTVKFSDDTLGYSSFPFGGSVVYDGDVIDYRSLPGGSITGYNLGDTSTHEIGHWFGLYHTFQGGCSATAGDYVSDTPAEAYPAFDCIAKDSCPSLPGTDPIKNFMDYAPDACMNTFTAGQRTRMQNEWLTYRAPQV